MTSRSFPPAKMLLVFAVTFSILLAACNGGPKGDGVWIPVPKDTSALGLRDHFISKKEIAIYRGRYDVERDTLEVTLPKLYLPKSEAFNKPSVLEILKDPKCVGIRIYYGATAMNDKSDFRLIIVGVDAQGKDLYIKKGSAVAAQAGDDGDGGLEYGQCDPPCYDPPPPGK